MFAFRLASVLALLLALASFPGDVSAKCEMTYEDLDNCGVKSSLFGNPKLKIPENEGELNVFCDQAKKSFECVGNYVETCMSSVTKLIFNGIQKIARKDFADRCVDAAGRRAFLEHIVCAKNAVNRDKVNSCVHGFVGQLNHQINLHASMSREERVQTSCCGIAQLHECLVANVQSACPKNLAYWRRKIIMSEHMERTCGEFQTVDYCDENASAQYWPKLKRVFIAPESEGVEFKYKSPVTALIVYMSMN